MRTLYVLLTRTHSLPSRLIHAATGDGFTHVSIALDRDLTALYSFARKYARTPLPAGLVRENLHEAIYARSGRSLCALYKIDVSDAQFYTVQAKIASMLSAKKAYRYNLLGVLLCKLDLAYERRHHMFCSQFVASLLADADIITLPRPASLMHPVDFIDMPGLVRCYEGPLSACDTWWQREEKTGLCKTKLARVYSSGR